MEAGAVRAHEGDWAAGDSLASRARWETLARKAALVLARIALGYLFFTNLSWKLPPDFGCPPDYAFTTGTPQALQRTSGLCDWIGVEQVWSTAPRELLGVPIGWAARLNGIFLENVVMPGIRVFGWLIFLGEALAAASLILGLLTRLGGLVALGLALQLTVGLAGIRNPVEWEWSYLQMILLSIVVLAFAPGRVLGLDALLRTRFRPMAERGSRLGRALLTLT